MIFFLQVPRRAWWLSILVLAVGCRPTPQDLSPLVQQAAEQAQRELRLTLWLSHSPSETPCEPAGFSETPPIRCNSEKNSPATPTRWSTREWARLRSLAESRRSDPAAHELAAWLVLLQGLEGPTLGRAIEHLEAALRLVPDSAEIRNDLAVLLLLRSEIEPRPADPARALELLDEARSLNPALPQAGFNRILALETLGLRKMAAAARKQLPGERQPQPPTGSGDSRSEDSFPLRQRAEASLGRWAEGDRPETANALLAEAAAASAAYAAASRDRLLPEAVSVIERAVASHDLLRVRRLREGHSRFRHLRGRNPYATCEPQALVAAHDALSRAKTPFAHWVTIDQAICAFFAMDFAAAERLLEPIAARAGHQGYLALEARARWLLALLRLRQGRFSEARRQCEAARHLFATLGETGHELYLRSLSAKAVELAGDEDAAWSERLPALRGLRRIPDPERRFTVLEEAAEAMEAQGRPALALAFFEEQTAAAEQARQQTGDADNLIFTLLGRQRLLRELGRPAEARANLDRAEALWRAQDPEDDTWQRQLHEIAVERALLDPRPGELAVFDRALEYTRRSSSSLGDQVEVLRLLRARAAQAQRFHQRSEATASLEQAILEIERQRLEIDEPELRSRFLAVARDVFEDRISLELGPGGDRWKALSYLERATNRLLLEASLALGPASPAAGLTPAALEEARGPALIVRYGHASDRLLLWTFDQGELVLEQRMLTAQALRAQIAACRSAVLKAAELSDTFSPCGRLAEVLLPQVVRTLPSGRPLLLIPDQLLNGVPFAALPDTTGRRPLLESHPLIFAPSLSLLVYSSPAGSVEAGPALFVVDPAFDTRRHPGLGRLTSAVRASAQYPLLYPGARMLMGEQADLSTLLPLLDRHALFHFDGHAVEVPGLPEQRGLLLAAPPGDPSAGGRDVLSAADLPPRRFRHLRRVILAGCSTAPRSPSGTSDWAGLAAAFLARGVPEVLTTSWDVADEPASTLLAGLHRRLASGEPAFQALQHAQLQMLRSGDRSLSAPASWAGYQCIGRPLQETDNQVRPK